MRGSNAVAHGDTKFKQTDLGPIPADWEVKKLGEIGAFSKGSGISRSESNSGNIPCVRYGEIYTDHNDYIREFHSFISEDVAKKSTRIKSGDILFAGSGETKEEIGKAVAYLGGFEQVYCGGDILILSPCTEYDSKYLGYILNTPIAISQKASRGQGDSVVHIRKSDLAEVALPLPPLPEQRAIAGVLADIDAEISALEAEKRKYESLKSGMMQELLTGKVRLA